MTDKEELQKARAFFKYVLTGLPKPIKLKYLTEDERLLWNTILYHRSTLLENLDDNSKLMGLNIPEHRCWCGLPAKYYNEGYSTWTCYKHYYENSK